MNYKRKAYYYGCLCSGFVIGIVFRSRMFTDFYNHLSVICEMILISVVITYKHINSLICCLKYTLQKHLENKEQ